MSRLSDDTPKLVDNILDDEDCRIETATVGELRDAEVDGIIEPEAARRIILGKKETRTSGRRVRLDNNVLARYFTADKSEADISDAITKALEMYFANTNPDGDGE